MNTIKESYKLVKIPASLSVTGKDVYHVLRQSYENIPGTETVETFDIKEAANIAKDFYNKQVK
jgi:hypothetical protein